MDIKSSDLSARLLATENLSVQRAITHTASFNVKSRVLTLPLWKDMTPEIEDMLVGHEVGHALYTTEDYFVPIAENSKIMSYLNVLEDVRIEKLIKRKYPGMRKRMNEGYKQLNDRDFFGVKQVQSFDALLLIDKINLYFKAGFSCGVEFSSEEKQFANLAERTETVAEVIELAEQIWAYSKEHLTEKKKKSLQNQTLEDLEDLEEQDDADDADAGSDSDNEFDDFEETDEVQERNPSKQKLSGEDLSGQETTPSVSDQELESKTEKAFAKKLEDLADQSTEYTYHDFDTEYYTDPVIGYKTILADTKAVWVADVQNLSEADCVFIASENSKYDKFKSETTSAVNYLVKEFEMRKSAALYKRTAVSKSGSLDMKKIYAYKLQDDLFKRVTSLPQGKNHGMVFLLDWSGSMDAVLEDTLKQVINLAMFCSRINIPYRVLAFTTQYNHRKYPSEAEQRKHRDFINNKWVRNVGKNILTNANDTFNLLELFSSKMTTSEFHAMGKRVINRNFQRNVGYSTGGTPLNEALVWMYLNIDKYIKQNSIEKLTLITLTDGEGGPLNSSGDNMLSETRYGYDKNGMTKRIKQKHFIRDVVTQKTYPITREANPQTETYLRMIKDRHNIMIVGFYICRNVIRDLRWALVSNLPSYTGDVNVQIESWRKDFRAQGFASVKNTGRDDLFLIPQTATKIVESDLDVKADANAKVIARDFGKFLNAKKTSRVLLNRFVGYVA